MKRRNPIDTLGDERCHREFRRITMRVMVDYVADGTPYCEYATTLGAGGMFVRTEEPLARGTTLKVRFRLGEAEHARIREALDRRAASGSISP